MRFEIYSQNPDFCDNICEALKKWCTAFCANIDILPLRDVSETEPECGSIIFLDVDHISIELRAGLPGLLPDKFAGNAAALFICSDDRRTAIHSYSLHPKGFLQKPLSLPMLEQALGGCVQHWIKSIELLEFSMGRRPVRIPLCQLIWAEASGRSSTLHCSHGVFQMGQPLSELVKRLPDRLFCRCQRSFLVNLKHVVRTGDDSFTMSDSQVVPIGKTHREAALAGYAAFSEWYT